MSDADAAPTSCGIYFLREFQLSKLGYSDVVQFNDDFTSSWLIADRRAHLKVRIVFMLLVLAIFVWSSADMGEDGDYKYWWLYITHWSLLLELFYFISAVYTQARTANDEASSPR
eukprot:7348883-Pyramimonas_sp.AAC.1